MLAEFPEPSLFSSLPGWKVEQFSNESLRFHSWMMRWEMNVLGMRLGRKLVHVAHGLMERLLRLGDGEPSYRQIFVMTPEKTQ